MPCYQCGGTQGSSYQLCPDCIAAAKSRRSQGLEALRAPPAEESRFFSLLTDWRIHLLAVVIVYALICIALLSSPKAQAHGALFSLALSGMLTASIVAALTYFMYWVELLTSRWYLAVIALIVPVLIWVFVFTTETGSSRPRNFIFLHFAAVFMAFSCAAVASVAMGKPAGHIPLFLSRFIFYVFGF